VNTQKSFRMWMLRIVSSVLLSSLILSALLPARSANAQEPAVLCTGLVFSTEEDFRAGVEPADGNPIISDGDLLSRNFPGPGVQVCARNRELLQVFQIRVDLGLDAVDVIDPREFLIAFSTDLDDPQGRFTAGDLLTTSGVVIPNQALLFNFALPIREQDLGSDAVQFVGERELVIRLLTRLRELGPDVLREEPGLLVEMLAELEIDIYFSTEGTGFSPEQPSFLDGDLLSARDGTIVISNSDLLPSLPAGLPDRGVDYGLDAFAFGSDPIEGVDLNLFSTEIVSLARILAFTDGDILQQGGGVFWQNFDLIGGFEPRARDLGLDALDFADDEPVCEIVDITRVGGIQVSLIDPATGYARKADGAYPPPPPPAPADFDRPFGNWVSIRGNLPDRHCVVVDQYEYRVEFYDGTNWVPIITHPAWQVNVGFFCPIWSWAPYQSNGDGWIPLADYWDAKHCAPDQALNVWNTSGRDGSYRLRLALRQTGMPATETLSNQVPIVLDNTAPHPVEMTLYDESGEEPLENQCEIEGEEGPTIITIKGRVRDNGQGTPTDGDEHFRLYQLYWTGGDVHYWDAVNPAPGEPADYRFYDTISRPAELGDDGTQPPTATDVPLGQLNLTAEHMAATGNPPIKCGYTIWLRAWDRTIIGGFSPTDNVVSDAAAFGWETGYTQSFCYTPAGEE
jgi:hypothetical protein